MKNVSVKSDKVILDADLFQVHESEVIYENGVEKIYKNIKRKPAVSVFPVTEDNQIYLVK